MLYRIGEVPDLVISPETVFQLLESRPFKNLACKVSYMLSYNKRQLERRLFAHFKSWCRFLDVPVGTAVQTPSPEPRDDPPSCFSCSDESQIDASEKVGI